MYLKAKGWSLPELEAKKEGKKEGEEVVGTPGEMGTDVVMPATTSDEPLPTGDEEQISAAPDHPPAPMASICTICYALEPLDPINDPENDAIVRLECGHEFCLCCLYKLWLGEGSSVPTPPGMHLETGEDEALARSHQPDMEEEFDGVNEDDSDDHASLAGSTGVASPVREAGRVGVEVEIGTVLAMEVPPGCCAFGDRWEALWEFKGFRELARWA